MPFQNSLLYCGRQIFRFSFSLGIYLCSKSFFRMKSAFSTILYFFCHFQPHLLCCIHDRLIHILHKCDCVHHYISEYLATIILPELSVLLLEKLFSTNYLLQIFDYISHTPPYSFFMRVFAAMFNWNSSLTHVPFFFQMFRGNMLQHLFWDSIDFLLFTFIVWKTFFMYCM